MHLYIMTRGIKNCHDQFITELQGKYLPFPYPDPKDPKHKLVTYHTPVHVRPIQMFEIVFPEDQKDIVLATVLTDFKDGRTTQHKKHNKFIWGIRKALGVDPIPKYDNAKNMPIMKEGVEVIGIGIKKDYWQDSRNGKQYNKKENEFCFEAL